jgi:hypothetical protein
MLISLLTFLLISNALSLRKDKSILFSRIVMVSLISPMARFLFAVYYLNAIKNIFFFKNFYKFNPSLENLISGKRLYTFYSNNIKESIVATMHNNLLLFIYIPNE